MKRYLAILYSSILFFGCLGLGFVRAEVQPVDECLVRDECLLQEQINKLHEDISLKNIPLGDISSDSISLSDISLDDISVIEQEGETGLSLGDKLKLTWFYLKIKTGEYKDATVKHISQNQRAYIWGASGVAIILTLASAYYFSQKNQDDGPTN